MTTQHDQLDDSLVPALTQSVALARDAMRWRALAPKHLQVAIQSLAFHLAMSQADKRPPNPFDEERQAALDAIHAALAEEKSRG